MTKTHRRILVLFLLIIVIGVVIPFLLSWEDKLKWSLDIARTISILSASILALFYFDPFGIRKSNLGKQHENVIQILEKIFSQRILAMTEYGNPDLKVSRRFSQHFMTLRNLKFIMSENNKADYLGLPILINLENFIDETKELVELKNSLFTPKSVAIKMSFLEFCSASRTEEEYKSFSIVRWGSGMIQNHEDLCDQINMEMVTLNKIFNNYRDLIDECLSWLKANSFSIKRLNID